MKINAIYLFIILISGCSITNKNTTRTKKLLQSQTTINTKESNTLSSDSNAVRYYGQNYESARDSLTNAISEIREYFSGEFEFDDSGKVIKKYPMLRYRVTKKIETSKTSKIQSLRHDTVESIKYKSLQYTNTEKDTTALLETSETSIHKNGKSRPSVAVLVVAIAFISLIACGLKKYIL